LRALRKVTGHIGRNVKPVYWKGMVEPDERSILVDPEATLGLYPIPHKSFDLLVGKVVLEGLASIEWSDWVLDKVIKSVTDIPEEVKPFFAAFLAAAEDIYIDELARPRVWSLYLNNFWKTALSTETRDPELPPSPDSLVNVWRSSVILGEKPDQLHYYYDDPLEILTNQTDRIREVTSVPTSRERRERRIDLYQEIWSQIYEAISEWEDFQIHPDAINMLDEAAPKSTLPESEEIQEPSEADEEEERELDGLDPDLAEEVRSIMEEGDTDLTQDIAVAVQEPEAKSMETFYKRGVAKTDVQPDELQVKRLRRIFREQESLIRRVRRRQIRRGLIEGKLDARRLYRVPLDGKVFKNRQAPGSDYLWQICIVADASASMAGKGGRQKPWHIAEKTFVSVAEAAKGFRNLLDIYAYNAEKNRCTLTQLYHGDALYSVMPMGRTPSGQAIAAAAMRINKKYKKSMIIHITDGAANCGLRISDAVSYCQKNNIEVFTIGCGCTQQTRNFLREAFPEGHVYFMKNINYLSVGLEYLFKRKILQY
jgi:hypothetical protein